MGVVFVWTHGGPLEPRNQFVADKFPLRGDGLDHRRTTRDELESLFAGLGIDCGPIAFYHHPAFKAAERDNPAFLQHYAEYVESRHYSQEYLTRVRQIVPRVAALLRAELAAGGFEGSCMECSLSASKLLEQLGLWNYVTAGSITVEFDAATGLSPQHWPHILGSAQAVGHAWIVAPPFHVIDLTIGHQKSTEHLRPHLPEILLADDCEPVSLISLDDLVHPDLQLQMLGLSGSLPTMQEILERKPEIERVLRLFPPFAVRGDTNLAKYFPCCITALDEPFESLRPGCFGGKPLTSLLAVLCRSSPRS